ncbi:hypothetical protein ACOSQ2_023897 [Xanthoceras sorbifolium]
MGGPVFYHPGPNPMGLAQCSTTLMPPPGSQALVTELGNLKASFDKFINTQKFSIQSMWDYFPNSLSTGSHKIITSHRLCDVIIFVSNYPLSTLNNWATKMFRSE